LPSWIKDLNLGDLSSSVKVQISKKGDAFEQDEKPVSGFFEKNFEPSTSIENLGSESQSQNQSQDEIQNQVKAHEEVQQEQEQEEEEKFEFVPSADNDVQE
jgi:hypothetical protein